MLAFFCLGARYRPWRYFAALHSRVFGDGAAPRRTCCSPQPRQHSVFRASGGGVLQVLPSVPFFFAGRAAVIWCGANPGVRPWQDLRECALGRLVVAIFSRDAFPGARRWQDSAAVRSRAAIRGNFFTPCIPKAASDGKIASSRQDSHAMHPKTGWPWQDMRAMHPKCPANRRWRIRLAKILPGRGTFRCTDPSNHAWRANLAIRRRRSALAPATPVPPTSAKPPERPRPRHRRTVRAARARSPDPRNTARKAAPPRRLLGSKYRQQLPRRRQRSLPTLASSFVAPANNSVIADSASCGDNIHVATAPLVRQAAFAQRRAIFPACGACLLRSWQMRSAYKRQAEPLLRDYFVMVA